MILVSVQQRHLKTKIVSGSEDTKWFLLYSLHCNRPFNGIAFSFGFVQLIGPSGSSTVDLNGTQNKKKRQEANRQVSHRC